MKITTEQKLSEFEFWSGAKDRAENLTDEEFDTIEQYFEDLYPDGMNNTQINDWFWFEFEEIAQWIGTTEDEVLERE